MGDETAKNILKNVTEFTEKLHEDEGFRSTVAHELYDMGYIAEPEFNAEQVHDVFVKAVNLSMKYTVDLRKDDPLLKEKLKKLLVDTLPSNIKNREIEYYLTDKLPNLAVQNTLKSPLDFLKEGCIKSSANQTFFKKLIECQFQLKWNTTAAEAGIPGHPIPFNYYEFCNEERKLWPGTTELKSLKNQVRRAHVLVQLFQMPVATVANLSLELTASSDALLCPSVYIRTGKKKLKRWNPTNKLFGETIDTDEAADHFSWMNNSIRSYILKAAEIIPDAEACLDRHTLYWAVIHDPDFQAGDELELNDIGRTQVYVGKADKGINGRWLAGHCGNMMDCLKDIHRMKQVGMYEPPKDVQLVEARLVLAKLRANENSALFVMKTFGHDIAAAENTLNSAQAEYNINKTAQNKRRLDRAKKASDNAKKKAEKGLIEAESRNIEGKRIRRFMRNESNYIIKDANSYRVRPRWQPL